MAKSSKIEEQIAALREALQESRDRERATRLSRVRAAAARAGMGAIDIPRDVLDREFRRIVERAGGAGGGDSVGVGKDESVPVYGVGA